MEEMNQNKTAIFFNAASVQKYVFGTNKLKHAIGASAILKKVYPVFFNADPKTNGIENGYIGGGNALLLYGKNEDAMEKTKGFTLDAIKKYPGLVFKTALLEGFRADEVLDAGQQKSTQGEDEPKAVLTPYQESMKKIITTAGKNTASHYPITTLPKHGITADCPFSGLSAEIKTDHYGRTQYISQSVSAKLDAKLWEEIDNEDAAILKVAGLEDWVFAKELDDMGQQKGVDSHIAIVHIDGNGIGTEFKKCKSLEKTIELSKKTDGILRDTFTALLSELKNHLSVLKKLNLISSKKITENGSKKEILPIRLIIIGGDDITFVCNSFLGVWVAQRFTELFTENSKKALTTINSENKTNNDFAGFTSCAGIAITKTKYPFYRGYKLAEELCASSKEAFYANEKVGNWIDFHLAMTDIPDSLENIRKSQYLSADEKKLVMRPYKADVFDKMVMQAIELKELPNDWIKSLRDSLYEGANSASQWKQKAEWRDKKVPVVEGFDKTIFHNEETPYLDLVELSEIVLPELKQQQQYDNL